MEQLGPKLYSWASLVDPVTLNQAHMTSKMPFIWPHLALMPDAHLGKGATVGSVIPTRGAIMPAAVGVDIGCGMMAVQTGQHKDNLDLTLLPVLRERIETAIPLSAGRYNKHLTETAQDAVDELEDDALTGPHSFDPADYVANWRMHLGSLGSGNHFIEVSTDETGMVWLFLHSGSRGIGNKLAQAHIKRAYDLCLKKGRKLEDRDLAYFTEDEEEFGFYIEEMQWAQRFALANRDEMMDRVSAAFYETYGKMFVLEPIRCHHNYTERCVVRDPNPVSSVASAVWLSRKGAIDASPGKLGLIPGSMGAASYIVRGKGNEMALNSAPHGAGRLFSRSKAKKEFTMDDLEEKMVGIEWRVTSAFLDEHPQAYKPIDVVMRDAESLVEVVHTLRQLVNVKGD